MTADAAFLHDADTTVAEAIHRDYPPSAGAQAMARLMSHEAVCALRYQGLMDRVGRLEKIIVGAASSLLAGMAAVIFTLLMHAPR